MTSPLKNPSAFYQKIGFNIASKKFFPALHGAVDFEMMRDATQRTLLSKT
jgi:hypothetical protein